MNDVYENGNGRNRKNNHSPEPQVGILEWFHINDYEHVESTVAELKALGVTHLRTGFSWADYFTADGEEWYDWLIPFLSKYFEILPCFLYTPPSVAVAEKSSAPPKNPKGYADFLDTVIKKYGNHFDYVELWNEPNNRSEYDYLLDESWETFTKMIRMASYWARQLGKKTVLGGMSPIDPGWLKHIADKGALEFIDVIGIHGFPDVFDSHWKGWETSIIELKEILKQRNLSEEIWITETGYSTWRYDEKVQLDKFLRLLNVPTNRVYWYSLRDLSQYRPTVDGFHMDEREYHFGLLCEDGREKLLYRLWANGGIKNIRKSAWMAYDRKPGKNKNKKSVLITGGAGFIGTNLANRLLEKGHNVAVYDNLSRPGVEQNLEWLVSRHKNIGVMVADVRDHLALEKAVEEASHVFHLAAQVAVTTSLIDPVFDFDVNLKGTINLLEAIRKSKHRPSLIFTSTNKVYGNLDDIEIRRNSTRYYPVDSALEKSGIGEYRSLDFHSPYGSSKGSADQYILDYARTYGLRNVVFRMSCIYGPHQFGTEDQGWVAHFILKALKGGKITLYGDGMQVRDILYVEDLIDAFEATWENIGDLKGEVFNMGGGPGNVVSLQELIKMLEEFLDERIRVSFEDWRQGDQKYYVSDFSKFSKATGWLPEVSCKDGVEKLYNWLRENNREIKSFAQNTSERQPIFK